MTSNRILHIDLRDHSLVPAEAEVHVTVVPEHVDGGTEARGRLMGPRCRFASTVEVAYHLRRVLLPTARPALTLRAVIPEASLWEPETPHLYAGPIELWQDGVRCEVAPVRHGLRHISVGPRGLRLNGRAITLRGREAATCSDGEALALRLQGYNLLVAPASNASRHIWEMADRLGFFVLGRIDNREQAALTPFLSSHPCCLGWLLSGEGLSLEESPAGTVLGIEAGAGPEPAQANVVMTTAAEAARGDRGRPLLLRAAPGETPAVEGAVVLGVVDG